MATSHLSSNAREMIKRLKELLKLVARNLEELDGTLTKKQKETLEKFEECMNEDASVTEHDAFSYGFRLWGS